MDPFLQAAVDEAEAGLSEGGHPHRVRIVHNGKIIGPGTQPPGTKRERYFARGNGTLWKMPAASRPKCTGNACCIPRFRRVRCAAARYCCMEFRM